MVFVGFRPRPIPRRPEVASAAMTIPPVALLGFSHVQLVVRDVERSAQWYELTLGLERFASGELASGPYAALRHREARLVVGLQTATSEQAATIATTGIDHLAFAVADLATLDAHRQALLDAGLEVGPIFDEAVSHNVRLRDPDGLTIELSAPRAGEGTVRPIAEIDHTE
jgi:glyoxylase I family protein